MASKRRDAQRKGLTIRSIVFIHGLIGGSHSTWSASRSEEPWPQTLLPPKLPNARILTCGYDAACCNPMKNVGIDSIQGLSGTLANQLVNFRRRTHTESHPIIFIAHSLGGLIVKDMLISSTMMDEYSSIAANTKTIIFMGTPHQGTSSAETLGTILRGVLTFSFTSINLSLMKVLEPSSEVIERIKHLFERVARKNDIGLVSFYERQPVWRSRLVSVPSKSETLC